jgi:hypothetical protein
MAVMNPCNHDGVCRRTGGGLWLSPPPSFEPEKLRNRLAYRAWGPWCCVPACQCDAPNDTRVGSGEILGSDSRRDRADERYSIVSGSHGHLRTCVAERAHITVASSSASNSRFRLDGFGRRNAASPDSGELCCGHLPCRPDRQSQHLA